MAHADCFDNVDTVSASSSYRLLLVVCVDIGGFLLELSVFDDYKQSGI